MSKELRFTGFIYCNSEKDMRRVYDTAVYYLPCEGGGYMLDPSENCVVCVNVLFSMHKSLSILAKSNGAELEVKMPRIES